MNTHKLFTKINDYTFIDVNEIKGIELSDNMTGNVFRWYFRIGDSDYVSYGFDNVEEAVKWLEDTFKEIVNFIEV